MIIVGLARPTIRSEGGLKAQRALLGKAEQIWRHGEDHWLRHTLAQSAKRGSLLNTCNYQFCQNMSTIFLDCIYIVLKSAPARLVRVYSLIASRSRCTAHRG
jgi:hypothetical protein